MALLAVAAAVCAVALGACGKDENQDAGEPEGTWKIDVISASFPGKQRLAQAAKLKIKVKNLDDRTLPNLAVTVDGFDQRRDDRTLANPNRPVWILNAPPYNSASAFTNTWTVGPVRAGEVRTLTWDVTAITPGTYSVRYRVAAGTHGRAKAVLPDGGPPKGSFIARISRAPRQTRVN